MKDNHESFQNVPIDSYRNGHKQKFLIFFNERSFSSVIDIYVENE